MTETGIGGSASGLRAASWGLALRGALVLGVLVVLAGLVWVLLPSFMMPGGPSKHFWEKVFRSQAPTGAFTLRAEKRVLFPANELFDPSIAVRITLKDERTGSSRRVGFYSFYEDSDFGAPNTLWSETSCVLTWNRGTLVIDLK